MKDRLKARKEWQAGALSSRKDWRRSARQRSATELLAPPLSSLVIAFPYQPERNI